MNNPDQSAHMRTGAGERMENRDSGLGSLAPGQTRSNVTSASSAFHSLGHSPMPTQKFGKYRVLEGLAGEDGRQLLVGVHHLHDAAARRARVIADEQYRAGTVSALNVVISQAAEYLAERAATDMRYRRIDAELQLLKTAGGRFGGPGTD